MSGRGQLGRAGQGSSTPKHYYKTLKPADSYLVLGSTLRTRRGHFFKPTLVVTENVQTTSFYLFPVLDTKLIHVPEVQGLGLSLNTSANPR